MTIALVVVLAAALGAVGALLVVRIRNSIPSRMQQILITLVWNDKIALRGVLFSRHGEFVILKMAAIVDADGTATRADGDLVVDRRQIGFWQVLPPS